MTLVTVEPGQKYNARFVILRRRFKDFPRQGDSGVHQPIVFPAIAQRQFVECGGGYRGDSVENT